MAEQLTDKAGKFLANTIMLAAFAYVGAVAVGAGAIGAVQLAADTVRAIYCNTPPRTRSPKSPCTCPACRTDNQHA